MSLTKHDLLESTKFKHEHLWTVSRKFKSDLIEFFDGKDLQTIVEVSGWHGYTTRVLSFLFQKVIFVEHPKFFEDCAKVAKVLNQDRNNIEYMALDVYRDTWPFKEIDVFFIDCDHKYDCTSSDIEQALRCLKMQGYLIFDDYSYIEDNWGVKRAIEDAIQQGAIKPICFIGDRLHWLNESVFTYDTSGLPEGVICQKV